MQDGGFWGSNRANQANANITIELHCTAVACLAHTGHGQGTAGLGCTASAVVQLPRLPGGVQVWNHSSPWWRVCVLIAIGVDGISADDAEPHLGLGGEGPGATP